MFIIFRASFFLLYLIQKIRSQCYITAASTKTLCYSCAHTHNFNFGDDWPGGEVLFYSTECKFMQNRPKLQIYISPNACAANSPCNGSLASPFDNLVAAFKFGWKSNAMELKFFLLSNMMDGQGESSIHFINKADYQTDFQYIFRRYNADISIAPL